MQRLACLWHRNCECTISTLSVRSRSIAFPQAETTIIYISAPCRRSRCHPCVLGMPPFLPVSSPCVLGMPPFLPVSSALRAGHATVPPGEFCAFPAANTSLATLLPRPSSREIIAIIDEERKGFDEMEAMALASMIWRRRGQPIAKTER
jgi:hypothetical protein